MDKDNINSTITELLKVIDEEKFNKLINVADVDKYVKKLTTYKFLQLMIVAQINELKSLSHITKKLKYNEEIQTSFLLDGIRTFQLSRKQRILTPNLFEKIFHHLVGEVLACSKNQPIFRDIGQLSMIDSSTMSMSLSQQPWATLSITKTGVRLHLRVVVIKDQTVPDNAVQLPTKHADRTQMDELTFENQNGL